MGGFGLIYSGTIPVAIKTLNIKKLSPEDLSAFKHEITIMSLIKSPYIVQLFGGCFEEGQYSIIMEYLPYPFTIIAALSSKQKYQCAIDIVCGVEYLHKKNIVHADLKSYNIMLTDQYRAKITDFGASKIKSTILSYEEGPGNAGSARWQAPELWEDGKTSKRTDIFSLGVVLWEVYSKNEIPFSKKQSISGAMTIKSNEQVVKARLNGLKLEIPLEVPSEMKKMIDLCMLKDPCDRPQATQLLSHLKEEYQQIK